MSNTNKFNTDFNDWKNGRGVRVSVTTKWESDSAKKTIYESGSPDETLENIIHGFVTCLIGQTWHLDTIIEGLKEYIEVHEDTKDQDTEI